MPNIERLDIATDGHGVLFKNKNPKKLPSAVKFPLREEDLSASRTFDKPDLPRGFYYAYVTPVGLSEQFRMSPEERANVRFADPALTNEQAAEQVQIWKRDFLDGYVQDPVQTEPLKALTREHGLKIGVLTGTPGMLYEHAKVWLEEQHMEEDLYEVFLSRNRDKGPTVSKLVTLRWLKPKRFVEDSLYTTLAVAVELEWLEVHNPLSFDEALRRELVAVSSVKSPDDIPESLKPKAIDLMLKRGGERIKFNSGFPEILREEQAKRGEGGNKIDTRHLKPFIYDFGKSNQGFSAMTA